MKRSMYFLVVAVILVLPGIYYFSDVKSDYLNVCPNNDLPEPLGKVISSQSVESSVNLKDWGKTATVSASKFPTGIGVFYRFEENASGDNKKEIESEYKLELLFSDHGEGKSIAYVYAHSGAAMKNSKNAVFVLKSGAKSKISIQVSAEKGQGGVAVVTCKNNRKSIISIDLPGYQIPDQ